ncbi:hypothetical protein ACHAXT_011763 [Thalassiosira profunda]
MPSLPARPRGLRLGRRSASQASGVAGENDDGTNNGDVSSAVDIIDEASDGGDDGEENEEANGEEEGESEEASGDGTGDEDTSDDDDESSVASLDEEDKSAFGHWDAEYYHKVNEIKDPRCTEFSLTEASMRSANRQGVPHLSVDACRSLGFYMRWAALSDLRISGLDLTTDAVQALFQTWVVDSAVEKYGCSAIEVILLGETPSIGSDHMITVSSLLRNNKNLRSLDLPRAGMSLEGVQNLAPVLTQQQLMSLNLAGNNLTDDAVRLLSEAVSKVKSLKILDLSSNCISAFSSVEPMFLDDAGRNMKQLNCPSLVDLSLKSNDLSEEFLCKLGVALYGNTHVKCVDIEGNDLSERAGYTLYRVLGGVGGSFLETFSANHCLTSFGDGESSRRLLERLPTLQRLLYINNLEVSPAEKARQKIKPLLCYAHGGQSLVQEVLDIDVKLMPYVLSIVGAPHPTIPANTPKLDSIEELGWFSDHRSPIELIGDQMMMAMHDGFRSEWMYRLVRSWNMPTLFGFHQKEPESSLAVETREELEKRKEGLEERLHELKERLRQLQETDANEKIGQQGEDKSLQDEIMVVMVKLLRVNEEITAG